VPGRYAQLRRQPTAAAVCQSSGPDQLNPADLEWSTTPTQGDIMTFNQMTTTVPPYDQDNHR
jgi:hypothetical protein